MEFDTNNTDDLQKITMQYLNAQFLLKRRNYINSSLIMFKIQIVKLIKSWVCWINPLKNNYVFYYYITFVFTINFENIIKKLLHSQASYFDSRAYDLQNVFVYELSLGWLKSILAILINKMIYHTTPYKFLKNINAICIIGSEYYSKNSQA